MYSYCVVSENTSWADYSACVVSRHETEQEAQQACRPGEWVEQLPENVAFFSHLDNKWVPDN